MYAGTANAVHQMKLFGLNTLLSMVTAADPSSTALAIIQGGATRAREVYYPFIQVKVMVLLKDWCPHTLSTVMQWLYYRD